MIPQIDKYIEENLAGIGDIMREWDKEYGDDTWHHYKGVIKEMLLEYGREELTDVQRMLQGNDIDGIDEYIQRRKAQMI